MKNKDVFTLIQKHNLLSAIESRLIELMDLDHKKTVALLLEKNISPEHIVERLKSSPIHLYRVGSLF